MVTKKKNGSSNMNSAEKIEFIEYVLGEKKCRSSHQRCSLGKGVLTNFAKFTGKHLCQSLLFK